MEETIVRQNLIENKDYLPYCGNNLYKCTNPRTVKTGLLILKCPECGWESEFPEDFVKRYKEKHNL